MADEIALGRTITIVLDDDDVPHIYVDGITVWAVPAILHAAFAQFAQLDLPVSVERPVFPTWTPEGVDDPAD